METALAIQTDLLKRIAKKEKECVSPIASATSSSVPKETSAKKIKDISIAKLGTVASRIISLKELQRPIKEKEVQAKGSSIFANAGFFIPTFLSTSSSASCPK